MFPRPTTPASSTHPLSVLLLAALVLSTSRADAANGEQDSQESPTVSLNAPLIDPVTQKWRIGVQIKGGAAAVKSCLVTIPIPVNWPEQEVTLVEENVPPEVRRVKFRKLNSGVQQMIIQVPRIQAGQLVEVTMVYRVRTGQVQPPDSTESFRIPKKIDREFRQYLSDSPQIHFRNTKLLNIVRDLIDGPTNDWDKVQAIYDWIRENVEYTSGTPQDSLDAFRSRHGCEEDLNGLFVGMCRAAKIPARMVWVEGNIYSEFMLVDDQDQPHWFPCQLAGRPEFASVTEPRVILQKGDDIKVPEKKERQAFVAEFVACKGTARPQVRFIRQLLPDDE